MITRNAESKVNELSEKYPVLLVTGPRQSGKTTLVKKLFPNHIYKNLENPDQRIAAKEDPKRFLELGTGHRIIIDEVQEVPELTSYIQVEVDEQQINSQFVLTGSQNFQISQTVSQSLAGRVAQFELLPLTYSELSSFKNVSLDQLLLLGSYPGKYTRNINQTDFYRDYVNTYITRDVRTLQNVGNLSNFLRFMQLVAGRASQLFNANELGIAVGVDYKTIQKWLSVLEASYIVFRLEPYYENFGKRLIKSPKLYFYDTGILNYLLGIDSAKELQTHPSYGNIFENFIIAEKLKTIANTRANEKLYFWRDNNGVEIDLLVDKGLTKDLVEIKSSQTFQPSMSSNIKKVTPIMSAKYQTDSFIVYQGSFEQKIQDVKLVNWRNF